MTRLIKLQVKMRCIVQPVYARGEKTDKSSVMIIAVCPIASCAAAFPCTPWKMPDASAYAREWTQKTRFIGDI